jgi:hypothetical protein
MTAFHAAARHLALHAAGKLARMKWRHHGLGMLQAEFDEELRIHLWYPGLRVLPRGLREVHDHHFDLESTIIVGSIIDTQYDVIEVADHSGPFDAQSGWMKTECWAIKHAKIQGQGESKGCSTATDTSLIGKAWTRVKSEIIHCAGTSYRIANRQFHSTRVTDLAITIVYRSNFDDHLARVLGDASDARSLIIPDEGVAEKALRNHVIGLADDALCELMP